MKTILLILLAFVAISSIFSGLMLIITPDGSTFELSLPLLKESPFRDFQLPGFILSFLVGGSSLAAVLYLLSGHRYRFNVSLVAGIMLIGWITGQIFFIQVFHWFQVIYIIIGILILLISWQCKGKLLL